MSEWKKVKLQDVCSSITDGDHLAPPKSDLGVPFITISNIDSYNHIDFSNCMYVPQEYYNKLDIKRKAQKGDILYSVVGSFGKPVLINDNMPFAFQRHIAILRPNNKIILPEYMYYVMLTYDFFMQADSVALGAAQRTISLTSLRNMTIKLAPLDEQRKIAYILSRYDSLIDNYQRQIKLLEEAAQRLYKEWFVDLHFPGYENTKIVDGVPEGWGRDVKLSSIADIIMGQSPKSEFYNDKKIGLPFHQGVGSYGDRFVVNNTYSSQYTRIAEKNSILFSVRAPVGRININKEKIAIGRGLASIKEKNGYQSFLFYLLKHMFFRDNIIGNGAIFASITREQLYDLNVMFPPLKLVRGFNDKAKNIDARIFNIDSQLRLLTEARDRLLPKLMSGEIEV